MLRGRRSRAARFGALAAVLALTAASAAVAAPGTANGGPASASDTTTVQLDSRTHRALLSLYALDSQLQAWRARLASLESAAAAVRRRQASLRTELNAARASLETGRHHLAVQLRALYERGNVDPVAVVLGAKSLGTALRRLDDLSRVANQSRQIVDATSAARLHLLRSQHRLAVEEHRLERSLAAARQAEERLTAAAASRATYVASLRAQARLHAQQVRSVEAQAQAAQQKSQTLQQPTTSAPSGKRQLTVSATCYDLPGRTATGMPVGQGVVAVDPSVIPLGTRMYVPGYGNAVAADVGGGITGNTIDLWMTPSQCAAWGRRTVTVTLY
ncbi:MAG TPA: 3D domain-containing protein [Gaiellaceae bacterium]|nr:3D domain-containing protein [Gaiellaceae bacterium]